MKQAWTTVAALAVCGSLGLGVKPAAAQGTGLIPVRAKIGVFLPQGDAKDFAGSTHFNGEIDVSPPNLGQGKFTFTAGYYQGSENGHKLRMVPITVGRTFAPPNPVSGVTGNPYFGLGAGPYFLRASGAGASESKTTIGGFGMAGYQFPNKFFVEAKYHLAGKVAGISPRGLALMVGRSF